MNNQNKNIDNDLHCNSNEFKNSLIIHKEIKQWYQRIGSRAYTFKTGNTLSV